MVLLAALLGAAFWVSSGDRQRTVSVGDPAAAPAPDELSRGSRRRAATAPAEPAPESATPDAPSLVAGLVVRVVEATQELPIAGAFVAVGDLRATTDAEGRASFELAAAGTFDVVARAPGHVRAEGSVEVALGEASTIDLVLAVGVAVEGRVVRDEDGTPIEGATIEATEGGTRGGASSVSAAGPLGSTRSGADGRFRLDGIPLGKMATLRASAAGRATASTTLVPPQDGIEPPAIELRLEAAGTIRGVVRDRGGSPLVDARVYLIPADAPMLLDDPDGTVSSSRFGHLQAIRTRTGDDGRFAVTSVPYGSAHFALARADGHATSEAVSDLRVDALHPVAVCELVVRAPGALDVTVLTNSGELVANGEVEVRRDSTVVRKLATDETGHALASGLDMGPYVVTVRATGLPKLIRAYAVQEGATLRVELRLPNAVALEGVIVDDMGRPLPAARVRAFRPAWGDAYEGLPESDDEGRFRIEGLLAGPHEIWAQEKGRPVTGRLLVVEAPGAGVRLVSLRRATLRFRLVPPQGVAPPAELHVHIGSLVYHPQWQDGPVEISELSPGGESVRVRIAGFVPFDRQGAFAAGEVTDLGDIDLDPGWDVRGQVVDFAGRAVADAAVRWGDVFTPTFQDVSTDAQGAFRLQHLPAGTNDVDVAAEGFLDRAIEVRVGRGETDARVVLVRGGLLQGTVRRPDGATAADVFVHVFDADRKARDEDMDDREEWERTDARGAFEARLLPGTYRVDVVWKRNGKTNVEVSADVELAEGSETPLVIDLTE